MLVKLYRVDPPEWFVGSIGLVFIATAIGSSVLEKTYADHRKKRSIAQKIKTRLIGR